MCVPVPVLPLLRLRAGDARLRGLRRRRSSCPAPSFDAGATLAAIAAERCTSVYGVPTMFVAQLDHPDFAAFDLSSLRTGIMAGSPCPLPLMEAVVETMGAAEITIGYGQTEASPIITHDLRPTTRSRCASARSARPCPGVEVKLVDPITGDGRRPGEAGELCVRGHGVMAGYYKNPEATARAIDADGWLHTGDLALRATTATTGSSAGARSSSSAAARTSIPPRSRSSSTITRPSPRSPSSGLPDPMYGEVVSAWVVPRPGSALSPDDVREFCRGQIAHFKIPHYVEIVPSLPKTVTGKIRKHLLRDQGIDNTGWWSRRRRDDGEDACGDPQMTQMNPDGRGGGRRAEAVRRWGTPLPLSNRKSPISDRLLFFADPDGLRVGPVRGHVPGLDPDPFPAGQVGVEAERPPAERAGVGQVDPLAVDLLRRRRR